MLISCYREGMLNILSVVAIENVKCLPRMNQFVQKLPILIENFGLLSLIMNFGSIFLVSKLCVLIGSFMCALMTRLDKKREQILDLFSKIYKHFLAHIL